MQHHSITTHAMGSGRQYDLQEIIKKSSSEHMKEHVKTLEKFLERGYRIEDQHESEELGLHGEQITSTLTTVLRPATTDLPMIKFEAKQIFGTYDYQVGAMKKWEESKFVVKMMKKSADIKAFHAPWSAVD